MKAQKLLEQHPFLYIKEHPFLVEISRAYFNNEPIPRGSCQYLKNELSSVLNPEIIYLLETLASWIQCGF